MYIYRSITYSPYGIGSVSIESIYPDSHDGYARAEPIPYSDGELENITNVSSELGVLYITVW